ncbi:lysozyme [Paucimonas lemoignei]|uniref:Lysozyme n=1 Tax=Paucimonas lemoignei TaxID=29443 RepID=A0A4R3HYS8_PAULE|nr:lysozyme [Paucimonas lemoignei]TCS38506.1 lysozyme [Paucimonas lemoignei]
MNDQLHISEAGLAIEKKYEKGPPAISPRGFATRMYFCDAGKPTIGWGHVIKSKTDRLMTCTINEAEADQLLRQDNLDSENAIKRLVKVELKQCEFDALCSLVLNIGATNFANSTLLRKLNASDRRGAADEFPRWNKYRDPKCGCLRVAKGLELRREDERALFKGVKNV